MLLADQVQPALHFSSPKVFPQARPVDAGVLEHEPELEQRRLGRAPSPHRGGAQTPPMRTAAGGLIGESSPVGADPASLRRIVAGP